MKDFITETHKQQCVDTLKELIAIPSVLNEGEAGTPFGKNIQKALETTLELAKRLGFETYIDPKGYYGYAEIGEGDTLIAILCHLDVVPAGDLTKWETNPFEGVIKDNQLFGRGSQDDKGPTVATMYAVKALLDAGVSFNKRVRFIYGTDEETLWRCMARYNELEEVADMGFAPDSSFPLTYAEKGLLQVKITGKGSSDLALELGQAFNVVPGKALYEGQHQNDLKENLKALGYAYETTNEGVVVLGEAKHSKDAAEGVNAIIRLIEGLSPIQSHPAIDFLLTHVGHDGTGGQLFGVIEDEPSGRLSFNVAGLTIDEQHSEIRIDMRIPVLADKEKLVKQLSETVKKYGLVYEEFDYVEPLYVPLDSELIQTLLKVYREMTGDMSPAMTSGGATFARTMKNCVAFGAAFPHTLLTEHQENERIPLDDLYQAMAIYAETIYQLLML
ncbi:M20 family metallopeptidase [Streptococcus pacificus]|uniref:Sapep family Mn(2+)-dependent dipeptidase n=1 Tax=Streptococcus pacificus TaxID=2740577 RepID=A0ABS0ZIC0_9STRE|nr:M20 family metallopeptidase [Streptococcus pacificus]MBJ8325742.1 Sapep family Mn(2+)-dependent dipeptidase [Streptococcus pacificus]